MRNSFGHLMALVMVFLLGQSTYAQEQDQCVPPPPGPEEPAPDDNRPDDWFIDILGSMDPNEIISPLGYDSARFVSVNDNMGYTITYENDPNLATAPAQIVKLYYPFSPKQDMTSFRLGSFGFNNDIFEIPPGRTFYSTRLDVRDSLGIYVDLVAGIDVVNQRAFWIYESIDPLTGLPPTDPLVGMLPVSDTTSVLSDSLSKKGNGYVNFYIKPIANALTRDTIFAEAKIVFDLNDTIPTNVEFNTIDAVAPTSNVTLLAISGTSATIQFNGVDDTDGSGVRDYDLFLAQDSANYITYRTSAVDTFISFTGVVGSAYHFFSLATDNTGNRESLKSTPDLTIIFTNEVNTPPAFTINSDSVLFVNPAVCVNDSVQQCFDVSDADNDPLVYSVVQNPLHGIVTQETTPTGVCITYTPALLIAGVDTVLFSVCDNNGGCDTVALYFDINALPIAAITPDGPLSFCQGGSVVLTASGGDSFIWSTGESTSAVTADTAGVYMVTVLDLNGCAGTISETVTVTPLVTSTVSILALPGNNVCSNTEVVFTATPFDAGNSPSYQWKINGTPEGTNNPTYTHSSFSNGDLVICEVSPDTTCPAQTPVVSNDIAMIVTNSLIWYADVDGDTYGDASDSLEACVQPLGYVTNNTDCDDTNANVNPSATEVCNGIDDNCDGLIDDADPNVVGQQVWYADGDGDGFGSATSFTSACNQPAGYVSNSNDCDDSNSNINPSATEICGNGIDDNCDGQTDEGCSIFTFYFDGDSDSFGDPLVFITSTNPIPPSGYVTNNTDCDDTNANVNPSATEVCNGIDDNCDGLIDDADPNVVGQQVWYADTDGDTFGDASVSIQACDQPTGYVSNSDDCNDANANVNPSAIEICGNGIDDNCDGQIDEGCSTYTYFNDSDNDSYGDPLLFITTTNPIPPIGYVTNNTDCDDTNANINPAATEICNGIDDNCNGLVDDADPNVVGQQVWYADGDGDGFGSATSFTSACNQPAGYVSNSNDCDDSNSNINPSATEICGNGIDDNCDGQTDEGCSIFTFYFDGDSDSFGDPLVFITSTNPIPPSGYVTNNTDCDDTNANVNPSATEVCNGIDDNCNGLIDDADPNVVGQQVWYADGDGDGFGSPTSFIVACVKPLGYVTDNSDCNDSNAAINPAITEICNGIDDNCNGLIDEGLSPQNPGAITGPATAVCRNTTKAYTVAAQPGVTFNWSAPLNASILSGQGTNSVTVRFLSQFVSGVLSVVATNNCGSSTASSLSISSVPPAPALISGPATVCRYSQNAYSIIAVPEATSYFWKTQGGSSGIVSGQGTLSAIVQFAKNGTTVQVRSVNGCGNSAFTNKVVATSICVRAIEESSESTSQVLHIYPNPAGNVITISAAVLGKGKLQILNTLGQQVLNQELEVKDETSPQIDISNLAAGVYMIMLQTENGFASGRFVKE